MAKYYKGPIRAPRIRALMPTSDYRLVHPEHKYIVEGISRVNSRIIFEFLSAVTALKPHPKYRITAMAGIPLEPSYLDSQREHVQSLPSADRIQTLLSHAQEDN
eukprot:7755206-Karenia_brevis.AAC.1